MTIEAAPVAVARDPLVLLAEVPDPDPVPVDPEAGEPPFGFVPFANGATDWLTTVPKIETN